MTYPFLIKVLNPLVFPTCNVLHQFQSNTQLATSEVMRPESLVFTSLQRDARVEIREGVVLDRVHPVHSFQCLVWAEERHNSLCLLEFFWNIFWNTFSWEFSLKKMKLFAQDVLFLMLFDWSLKDPRASALRVPVGVLRHGCGGAEPALINRTQKASRFLCLRLRFGHPPNHLLGRISGVKHYSPVV